MIFQLFDAWAAFPAPYSEKSGCVVRITDLNVRSLMFCQDRPGDDRDKGLPRTGSPACRSRCPGGWKSRLKKLFLSPD